MEKPKPANQGVEKHGESFKKPEKPGFIDRFLKKEKLKPESQSAEKTGEQPEKPKILRFAENVLRLIKPASSETKLEKSEEPKEPETPLQPEKAEQPKADEILEEAKDTRHFAAKVFRFVIKVLSQEQVQPSNEVAGFESEQKTGELKLAADDLGEAIDELDGAIEPAAKTIELEPSQAPTAGAEGDWNPPKNDVEPRSEQLAVKDKNSEKTQRQIEKQAEKILPKTLSAKIGLIALGAAIMIERQFKKNNKERRNLKQQEKEFNKILKEQKQYVKEARADTTERRQQQNAEINLRQADRLDKLSDFTHKQADTTRETAKRVRQEFEAPKTPDTAMPKPEKIELKTRPSASESKKSPEQLKPVTKVESAESTEYLSKDDKALAAKNQSIKQTILNDLGLTKDNSKASSNQHDKDEVLDEPKNSDSSDTQPYWLYTAAIGLIVIVLGLMFIFG